MASRLLKEGIESVVLILPQGNAVRLAEAIAAGVAGIDKANAKLTPEEKNKHVTVIFVFPESVPGEELAPLILAEEQQENASATQA